MMAPSELVTAVMRRVPFTVKLTIIRGDGCINRLRHDWGGVPFNIMSVDCTIALPAAPYLVADTRSPFARAAQTLIN